VAEKVRVGLAIECQDVEAINNIIKFAKAQDKVGESTRRVNQEARDQGAQVGVLQGVWQKALTTMGGIVSIGTLVRGAKAAVQELIDTWNENQTAVEENIAALSRFSAISTLSAADRELVLRNVGHMEVGQAARIAFAARSALMDDAQIIEVLREASQAKQLGEDPEMFGRSIIALQQGVFGDRTISQIANFLTTMAEKSPLSADTYAEQFTRIGGVAGATMEEKAAGGALMSAIVKSMGVDASPQLASTAAKGFLVKRKTVGAEFLENLGLADKSVPEQIQALAELAATEEWTRERIVKGAGGKIEKTTLEKQFMEVFGERTAPSLIGLLRSPEALERIAPDTAAGVAALQDTGLSMFAEKVEQKTVQDPEWRMQQEAEAIRAQRAAAKVKRGYTNSPYERAQEQMAKELEEEQLPIVGEAGSVKLGVWARASRYMAGPAHGDPITALGMVLAEFIEKIWYNREELEKNTEAIKELEKTTRATQGQDESPVVVDTGGTVE